MSFGHVGEMSGSIGRSTGTESEISGLSGGSDSHSSSVLELSHGLHNSSTGDAFCGSTFLGLFGSSLHSFSNLSFDESQHLLLAVATFGFPAALHHVLPLSEGLDGTHVDVLLADERKSVTAARIVPATISVHHDTVFTSAPVVRLSSVPVSESRSRTVHRTSGSPSEASFSSNVIKTNPVSPSTLATSFAAMDCVLFAAGVDLGEFTSPSGARSHSAPHGSSVSAVHVGGSGRGGGSKQS